MNFFSEIFKKKPVVRPESVKALKKRVIDVPFSDWIQELKRDAPDTNIRIKRTEKLTGQARGYLGNPIPVSSVEAATFDRILFESFGGGSYVLEYWNGDHLIMQKNSEPLRAVTHKIDVAGYEKPLPGKRTAGETPARPPQGPFALMLKQLDTAEGIAALTGFFTLAREFFKDIMTSKQSGGGVKDIIETISAVTSMIPAPPDEIEQLERLERIRSTLTAGARPPVNIGNSGSSSAWDSIVKSLGSVLGTAIATAQQKAPQGQLGVNPATPAGAGEIPAHLQNSQPQVGQVGPVATPDLPGSASQSQAPAPDPRMALINAKITAIQSAMKLNMEPAAIADEILSLLDYLVRNGIVDQSFVDNLNADPYVGFDQIMMAYVPESKAYAQLGAVKQIVVGYILDDGEQGSEESPTPEPEPEVEPETPEEGRPEEKQGSIITLPDSTYTTTEETEVEQEAVGATED